MSQLNLNDLIDAVREVDAPSRPRADRIFERLQSGLAAPVQVPEGETAPPPPTTPASAPVPWEGTVSPGTLPLWGKLVIGLVGVLASVAVAVRLHSEGKAPVAQPTVSLAAPAAPIVPSGSGIKETPLPVLEPASTPGGLAPAPQPSALPVPNKPKASALSPEPKTEPRGEDQDELAGEIALLRRAKLELNQKNPRAALSTLGLYEAKFPSGKLQAEAAATKVLALCALEQRADAARAGRGIDDTSPLAERLGSGCPVSR